VSPFRGNTARDKLGCREALGLGGLLAGSAVPGAIAAPAAAAGTCSTRAGDATGLAVDLIVLSARVITMEPAQPTAARYPSTARVTRSISGAGSASSARLAASIMPRDIATTWRAVTSNAPSPRRNTWGSAR
jgi:hypothetical protein